jgi:hypothetical protein
MVFDRAFRQKQMLSDLPIRQPLLQQSEYLSFAMAYPPACTALPSFRPPIMLVLSLRVDW